jgi:hypothetical protein
MTLTTLLCFKNATVFIPFVFLLPSFTDSKHLTNVVMISRIILKWTLKISSEGNCALLGYYAASGGNFLPKVRDNLSVPSSGVKNLD